MFIFYLIFINVLENVKNTITIKVGKPKSIKYNCFKVKTENTFTGNQTSNLFICWTVYMDESLCQSNGIICFTYLITINCFGTGYGIIN